MAGECDVSWALGLNWREAPPGSKIDQWARDSLSLSQKVARVRDVIGSSTIGFVLNAGANRALAVWGIPRQFASVICTATAVQTGLRTQDYFRIWQDDTFDLAAVRTLLAKLDARRTS